MTATEMSDNKSDNKSMHAGFQNGIIIENFYSFLLTEPGRKKSVIRETFPSRKNLEQKLGSAEKPKMETSRVAKKLFPRLQHQKRRENPSNKRKVLQI